MIFTSQTFFSNYSSLIISSSFRETKAHLQVCVCEPPSPQCIHTAKHKIGEVYSTGVHLFRCFLCNFAHHINFNLHTLQTGYKVSSDIYILDTPCTNFCTMCRLWIFWLRSIWTNQGLKLNNKLQKLISATVSGVDFHYRLLRSPLSSSESRRTERHDLSVTQVQTTHEKISYRYFYSQSLGFTS